LRPKIKDILPIWWAWQWRTVLASLIGSIVLVIIFSFFAALLGVSKETIIILSQIIYYVVAIYASIYFFAYIFSMRFKRVKPVLFRREGHYAKRAALI